MDNAATLYQDLCEARRAFLASQLEVIRAAFPEVAADAERYRAASVNAPWELYDALNPDEPIRSLREKYQLWTTKHRPAPEDVPPLTNLFFEAYALAAFIDLLDNGLWHELL